MKAVDVQCFGGGFTLGAVQAGFELAGKREFPGGFGVESVEANRHLLRGNWQTQVSPPEEWEKVDAELVFGNPPCSGFSIQGGTAWRNLGIATGADAPINDCMRALVDYAAKVKPEVVIFESVQNAFKTGRELMVALRAQLERKSRKKYELYHVLHNAAALGGCVMRPRYFFVASAVPFGVELPELFGPIPTIREAIGDLQPLKLTRELQAYRKRPAVSDFAAGQRAKDGLTDGHFTKDSALEARIKFVIDKFGWDEGQSYVKIVREHLDELPDEMFAKQKARIERGTLLQSYEPTRWSWDKPGRVIDGGAMVVHPKLPRLATLRELFRIQGFSDDWYVGGLSSKAWAYPGKGIPVQSGRWIAGWAKQAISGRPGSHQGEEIGKREHLIDASLGMGVVVPKDLNRHSHTPPRSKKAASRPRLTGVPRGKNGRAIHDYYRLHPSASPGDAAAVVGCSVGRVHEALRGLG